MTTITATAAAATTVTAAASVVTAEPATTEISAATAQQNLGSDAMLKERWLSLS